MYRLLVIFLLSSFVSSAQLPEGFGLEEVITSEDILMGIDFANDSVMFYWTKRGKVHTIINDTPIEEPLLDLTEECAEWGDHGILGFCLDPQFSVNGRIYLLYVVENNWLFNRNEPDYDPNQTMNNESVIGRVTRYEVDLNSYTETIDGSRTILLGDSIHNAIVLSSTSHSLGSLVFGSDGTLIVSAGDGSTWTESHAGGAPYPELAFEESGIEYGMMPETADLGSFKAQSIHTLNGKLMRIHPETGQGIPSNPFYLPENPYANQSKVWAMGLRNPYRVTIRPQTGSTDPTLGSPGALYLGDVGNASYEEINVCDEGGLNFGWPIYEGMDYSWHFLEVDASDPFSYNPMVGAQGCPDSLIRFRDLITQPNAFDVSWPNPCDPAVLLPDSQLTFVHSPPAVTYSNFWSNRDNVFTGDYDDNGNWSWTLISDDPSIETIGDSVFAGAASMGGDFYYGTAFPEEYFGAFFHTDYAGWCRVWWFDQGNDLYKVEHFSNSLGLVNHTRFNPYDESMYFTTIEPEIKISRLVYNKNLRPVALAEADTLYGVSPLTVQFMGSNSTDPDEDPLSYHWEFGDGESSDQADPMHVFTAPDQSPFFYEVTLTVSDTADNQSSTQLLVSLNNTPPEVTITSIEDSTLYGPGIPATWPLEAEVIDQEHAQDELSYKWVTFLHHNDHYHEEEILEAPEGVTHISPFGCDILGTYYYRIGLEVTDGAGLRGYDEVWLYPDCDSSLIDSPQIDDFVLYPNPSSGALTLRGPVSEGEEYTIQLIDNTGRVIREVATEVDRFDRIGLYFDAIEGQYILNIVGEGRSESIRFLLLKE